jgi:adenosine deaminase
MTSRPSITPEFIRRIPKTDLHLHLDGSLRIGSLIEMAKSDGVKLPSREESGLRELVFKDAYANLPEYLQGFQYTCAVLQSAEHLERAAYELALDNLAEGVRYIEVRFAPQLHIHEGLQIREVLSAVCRGLDQAKREHNRLADSNPDDLPFEYGVIVCAMRSFHAGMSPYFNHLLGVLQATPRKEVFAVASLEMARAAVALRDETGLPIVGFDLAGEESGYPAGVHRAAYQYAHSHFLKKTVHAGEAYGPESIFQAITDCHANRIGHGTFLFASDMICDPDIESPGRYVAQLANYIASQRITVEVCLTSNLQTTPTLREVHRHPLARMIEHDLSVTLCTDNRLVSNTSVCRELQRAADHLPLTRRQFRNLILAGFKGSFFPTVYTSKRDYVRRAIDLYEKLESRLLPPRPA